MRILTNNPQRNTQGGEEPPVSCGALDLNSGERAYLFEEIESGIWEPVLIAETDPLCLAAVADLDGGGIVGDGWGGYEDGDW